MKKILTSLALVLIYSFVSSSSGLPVSSMWSMQMWEQKISSNVDKNLGSCMNLDWTCKHASKCHISDNNIDFIFQSQKLDKLNINKIINYNYFSLNKINQKINWIRWPIIFSSFNFSSNYSWFLKFKKIIVLRV